MKSLMIFTLIGLVCYAGSLHAAEPLSQHSNVASNLDGHKWIQSSDKQLLVNIPTLLLSDIKDQMYKFKSNLITRKKELITTVKNKEFTFADGLITLILPGGVLYAAVVKRNHIKIKNELHEISSRLNEINHDISNLITQTHQPKIILIARN